MKVLGIDSSSMVASVAVIEDKNLQAEYTINYKKTHSQTLVPMLDEVKKMIDLDFTTVDCIAVAAGPGSFTGLRIGSATAKGLAQALQKPIAAIPTIDGLAYNLYGTDKLICPMMDARRNQTYTGIYQFVEKENKNSCNIMDEVSRQGCDSSIQERRYILHPVVEQCVVMVPEIIEKINQLGKEVIFLGDGMPVFTPQIQELCKVPFSFAPAPCNRQRGASIAALGLEYFEQGKVEAAEEHGPDYLRLSQAERERKEKE
ncbi:MAG: tRNA (adenosine(37)-N6)-threonylcarbamoyltransferase complex dimerization subunit type 1 TsaB [Eubacteriales bacterium]